MGMANVCRPGAVLELSGEERGALERWSRRRKSSGRGGAVQDGVGLLRGFDERGRRGPSAGLIPTPWRSWRRRFLERRVDRLVDEPRPGRPATITIDQVEDVIVATLESTPKNATPFTGTKTAEETLESNRQSF
jgi:hypothetical protein